MTAELVAPVRFDLDPSVDGLELLRRWAADPDVGGFPQRLRARPVEFREGFVRVVCDMDAGHANFVGLVHGGVTASLVDIAAGSAVMTILKPGELLLTSDLTLRFLNPAPLGAARLEAVGTISYRDARRAVVEVEVITDDGVRVAQGSAAISIRPPRP